MKALQCELCGSGDIVKDGDYFVCQSCGIKYTLEQAKKMLVEGSVVVENVGTSDKYIELAKVSASSGNMADAEKYANKVIEIDLKNPDAWFIKGQAAGWQSSLANDRFNESINCWKNTMEYSPEDKKEDYKNKILDEGKKLTSALLQSCADNFASNPSKENANTIVDTEKKFVQYSFSFNELFNTKTNSNNYTNEKIEIDNAIKILTTGACSAVSLSIKKASNSMHGGNIPAIIYACENIIDKLNNCEQVLFLLRAHQNVLKDISIIFKIYDALETICAFRNESYSMLITGYDGYRLQSKMANDIAGSIEYSTKLSNASAAKLKSEEKRKAYTNAKNEFLLKKYWESHTDEKEALEKEKAEIQSKLDGNNTESTENPRLKELNEEIEKLKKQKASLGMFSKEKKEIQTKINELTSEKNLISANETLAGFENKKKMQERLKEIEKELKREITIEDFK